MLLIPLRVEDAAVDRVPWVSIGIAGICVLAFLATWVAPANPEGSQPQAAREIVKYYQQHPYLSVSDEFVDNYLRSGARQALDAMHEDPPEDLDAPTRDLEQRHLDSLVADYEAQAGASTLRRFALVPARGALQPGWLTAMFLHFGWMHIIGNLFFFYLTGPLLEDLWGRAFFGAFYVVGGLVAALAHFALDPHSTTMMAGASGAIAACIGAFAWRCASRRIRMAYWIGWYWRGTFLIPAWIWAGAWFLLEVLSFVTHSSGGVAVMAHIGGFLFGFAGAVALEKSGFEAQKLAPAVSAATTWEQHAGIDAAREALERSDGVAASDAYRKVLRERPDDREALVGVAKLENDPGKVEPLIHKLLAAGEKDAAWDVVIGMGAAFDPARISERTAWALAGAGDSAPQGMLELVDQLDLAVGKKGGPLAAKALLRLARRCQKAGRLDEARRHVAAARALPAIAPEMRQQIEALAAQVGAVEPPPSPQAAQTPAPASAVRILSCKLLKLDENSLQVESTTGQQRNVELQKLVGVAAGVVAGPQGASILTDLIVSWGDDTRAPAAIRIAGGQLGLPALYPGVPAKEAYSKFMAHLLARPAARLLPGRDQLLKGDYPRFATVAALNAAFYRRQT